MNEEKLKQIEQELMDALQKEDDMDSEIESLTQDLTDKLIQSKQTMYEVNNVVYSVGYGVVHNEELGSTMHLIAYDRAKFALLYDRYKPLKLSAELNKDLTEYENLKGVVEAFIRYKLDRIKPEELED